MDLRTGIQDARLRSQVDHGPPMMRQRFTAAIRLWSCTILVTGAEKVTLDYFFGTTLAQGSLSFDWRDENSTAAAFRFVSPPSYRVTKPHNVPALRRWEATLELEILP